MGDINDTLVDVGAGLGSLFSAIDTPLGTLLIVVSIAGAVGAILYGVAKAVTNRT